jgi:ATP-dependent Zn protease
VLGFESFLLGRVLTARLLDAHRRAASEADQVTAAREAIAYHEAGHAVISMKLGYRCLYVTIIPDGNRLGHVCCEDPLVGAHDDKIKDALKVLMAASLAESRHFGSRTWGCRRPCEGNEPRAAGY